MRSMLSTHAHVVATQSTSDSAVSTPNAPRFMASIISVEGLNEVDKRQVSSPPEHDPKCEQAKGGAYRRLDQTVKTPFVMVKETPNP